jgi:hypothetical protein
MQMARVAALLSVILVLLNGMAGCQPVRFEEPPPLPTRDDLVGTWLGLLPYSAYRLDLRDDGSASLSVARWIHSDAQLIAHMESEGLGHLIERDAIRSYESDRWELDASRVWATFRALDGDREPVYFSATVQRTIGAEHALSYVSISLSPTVAVVLEARFLRESRVREWLEMLTADDADQ